MHSCRRTTPGRALCILGVLGAFVIPLLPVARTESAADDAQVFPTIRNETSEILKNLEGTDLSAAQKEALTYFLSLPSHHEPRSLSAAQEKRVAGYEKEVSRQFRQLFGEEAFRPDEIEHRLIAEKEKVDGYDCLGAVLETPLGSGYLKVTYNHFVLLLPRDKEFADEVEHKMKQWAEVAQPKPTASEVLRLEVAELPFPRGSSPDKTYYLDTANPLVLSTEIAELTESQLELKREAEAALGIVLDQRLEIFARNGAFRMAPVGTGVFGESIVSFPEAVTEREGRTIVREAYIARFFMSPNVFCVAVSRWCDVWHVSAVEKRSPGSIAFQDWFDVDVDEVFAAPKPRQSTGVKE